MGSECSLNEHLSWQGLPSDVNVSQQKEQFSQRFFAVLEIMFFMMCCKENELKRGQRMLLLFCWLCCLPPFLAAAASGQTDLLFIPTKNVTDSHWTSKRLPFDGYRNFKLIICYLIVSSSFFQIWESMNITSSQKLGRHALHRIRSV